MKVRSIIMLAATLLFGLVAPLHADWKPGLQGGTVGATTINTIDYPATTNIYSGPHAGKTQIFPPWAANTTWVYWGQIYLEATNTWFAENIDDAVHMRIWNGVSPTVVLNDGVWNVPSAGSFTAPSAGWYPVEIRLFNGGSGAGPTVGSGWTSTHGFGYKVGGASSTSGSDYIYPEDNGAMSLFRYDDGMGFGESLWVVGNPAAYGTVSPAYGWTNGLEHGDTFLCVAPEDMITVATGTRVYCSGYSLTTNNGQVVTSGTGTTYPYTHSTNETEHVLTWQWAYEFAIRVDAGPGGSATAIDDWYADGTPLAITAIPDSGYRFLRWQGDTMPGEVFKASTTLFATRPRHVTALFVEVSDLNAKVYTGTNSGLWEVAANWSPSGVPTINDAVCITNRHVKVRAEAAVGSLELIDGGLYVAGSGIAAGSQQAADPVRSDPVGLLVANDLYLSGLLSIGGAGQQCPSYLTVGGDLTLAEGRYLFVYAGPGEEDNPFVKGGAVISVAGTTTIGEGCWVVPDANPWTGAPVIFDLQHVVVAKSGGFDATQRGYGWINMGTNVPPIGRTYEKKVADYWCTLAPGAGYDFTIGGGYGGLGGNFSATRGRSYGNRLVPIQPGSPNGVYSVSGWRRGGGAIRIHARDILLEGRIMANAGSQSLYGGSSGGGIWITCDTLICGIDASLQAEGGTCSASYRSSGAGGRIAIAQGLDAGELDALMMGQVPNGLIVTNIEMLTTSVIGGLSSIRAESGTAVLTRSADAPKTLAVVGQPLRAGAPLIPYGQSIFEHGQWVTNSVEEYSLDPATEGTVRYRCAGYTLSNSTGFVDSGSGFSVEIKMDADHWLTWHWVDPEWRFLVQAEVNGTLQVGATTEDSFLYWLDSDAEAFTVTALPDSGYRFLCWEGEVPLGEVFNPMIEVPIRFHPRTLTARFIENNPSFSVKRYIGPDNGSWELASNWEPAGEPTAVDAVHITNHNVFVAAEAAVGRLVLSGGALIVGGGTTTVTAQQPSDLTRTAPVGLRVVSDAWVAGNVSLGGLNQLGSSYLNVGGDLTLTGGKSLAIYAGPSTGPAPFKAGGARVIVAGTTTLSGNSWIYPDCDRFTGHPVLFDLQELSVDASSGFNATQRGYGWIYYGAYPPPSGLVYESAPYLQEGGLTLNNYWISVAPGIGENYYRGGGYGGRGGNYTATRGLSYGNPYAPLYSGSPNGIYNGVLANSHRGGGAIRICASEVALNGSLLAEAGTQSMYGGSAGGGIWLICDNVQFGATAYLSVEGGNNQAYESSGGGGRISVALGLNAADLEMLANAEMPAGLVYEPLDQVAANILGGRAKRIDDVNHWMAESGTATLVSAADAPKFLRVCGAPLEAGVPEPFYGTYTHAHAQVVAASAPRAGPNPILPTERFICQGYVLSNATEEVAAGTTNELTFTMSENLLLTWLWDDPEIRSLVETLGGGRITLNAQPPTAVASAWMAVGATSPVIMAVPDTGYEFLYWLGEVPYGLATSNPLQFTGDVPRRVTALFRLDEPRTTRIWNGGTTPGNWHNPSLWLPAGNLPGRQDDVIIAKNYCLVSNYVEVGSLTLSNAAIVRVAALTAANRVGEGVHTLYHLALAGTRIDEARVVVQGDLTLNQTAQIGIGANNQSYAASLDVGGDLRLTSANRLAIFGGPTNTLLNHMTGTAQVHVDGQMRLESGSWVYPGSDRYTGGSVRFDLNRLIVATNAGFNASGLGFDRLSDRDPVILGPGKGYSYTIGGGYGGKAGSANDTYGKTYGFLKAPWLPGSCNGDYQPTIRGGGLIRIHANSVDFNGSLLANSPTTSWAGGPSGGGIWVTARERFKIGPKVVMSVKGGPSNYTSRGGGGRIALALQFTAADIESLFATGEPISRHAVLDRDAFLESYPAATVDLVAYDTKNNKTSGEPGTFVLIDATQHATLLILR